MARKTSSRRISLAFLVLVALGVSVYHMMYLGTHHALPHGVKYITSLDWKWTTPLEPDQICQFPNLDPFDPSILEYIEAPRDIHCKGFSTLTWIDTNGILSFNSTALKENGYSNTSLYCFYQSIERVDGNDDEFRFGPKQKFTGSALITAEFINIWCMNWLGWKVYANIQAQPRKLPFSHPPRTRGDHRYNVVIFGVDSLSKLNAFRHLPKTYRYLTKYMEAIVLEGLVKVGDNTYPNMVAVLTGRKTYTEEIEYKKIGEFHDDWPIVWKDFARAGYVTMYAEDVPEFNLFNHLASGFKNVPTDHYFRPFWLAVEKSTSYKFSSNFCFGDKPKHLLQMNYVYSFLEKYKHVPHFALSFLTEIGHDFMNQLGAVDNDFENFLKRLFEGGLLNDTFFIFMGDHGHRFDPIRLTPIGHLEESMPFSAIFVPPSIRSKFPNIMRALTINRRRLVSFFDFYDTLVDILRFGTESAVLGGHPKSVLFRGQSLFTELPKNRTCESVGIPSKYCVCNREESLPLAHPRVIASSRYLLEYLNDKTENYRNICSALSLMATRTAMAINPHQKQKNTCTRIAIETNPGRGLFEGIVCFNHDDRIYYTKEEISRLNMYKGQDWCLKVGLTRKNDDLRKYCYCT